MKKPLWKRSPRIVKDAFIYILLFLSIAALFAYLAGPYLLRLLRKHNYIKYVYWFMSPLLKTEYKAEYIGSLGGVLGSVFAVYGAYSLQRNTERKADADRLKKYVTIVYYDIYFFFREINELHKWVKDATKANLYENHTISDNNKESKVESQRFKKIRAAATTTFVHIDKNWIEDVAELSCKLSEDKLELIYKFYGRATEIKLILQNNSASELTDEDVLALKEIMATLYKEKNIKKSPDEECSEKKEESSGINAEESSDNSEKKVEFPQEYQDITDELQKYM